MAEDDTPSITLEQPTLEPPPSTSVMASQTGSFGSLFSEEEIAQLSAKLAISESFLGLLTRDSKFNDFMRDILVAVMAVVKSEAGSILEVDPKKNSLFFRAVVGQSSDEVVQFEIPMGQGVVGHVAESKQPLVVSKASENPITNKAIQNAVAFQARNLIAVPILIRGRTFGVIELLNRVGEENFTNSDLELLNYIAEMAAKTIEVRLMLAWVANHQDQSGRSAA